MVVVAVAGGSGGVGGTVLDAIAASVKHNRVFEDSESCLISSIQIDRTKNSTIQAEITVPRHFAVDYTNLEQMKHTLQENNVEVVVSALLLENEDAQNNLIRAAAESKTGTKFISSEYYIDFHAPIP